MRLDTTPALAGGPVEEAPGKDADRGGGGGDPPVKQGAAEPAATAGPLAILIGYGAVVVGAIVGIVLWNVVEPAPLKVGAGISVFAPLYILAQAIERFIEPFSTFLGAAKAEGDAATDGANKRHPEAMKAVYEAITEKNAELAAKRQKLVDQIRKNKAVIAWGLASLIGMGLCGALGIFMLRTVGFVGVPEEIDIVISGLAVGSGTKPLHDLISNLQKSKEQKDDPPEKKAV
jgi:hypothetical protein